MRGIIVCGGSIKDYSYYKSFFKAAGLLLCADGGAAHFRRFGIIPDILLGDFDSIAAEDMEVFSKSGVEIIKFPVEKDFTDTELAIDIAAERGCSEILLLGALGTRLDHSLSNIFMLKKIMDMGLEGIIVDEHNEIRLIDRYIKIKREPDVKITLLPFTDTVYGVTTKGLYYPLNKATIKVGPAVGVSNEFAAEYAEVEIEKGLMLVFKSKD